MTATMKSFPWKCMHCRERTVSPATLPSYESEVEHDGRKYTVTMTDFPVLQCGNCAEILLDDEANQKITAALRTQVGLLFPAEIRRRREALHLTQKQVASSLQISESTLSRWETGAQLQQRCMDKFLRAFFDLKALRNYLEARVPGLPEIEESALSEFAPQSPQAATYMASERLWEELAADFGDLRLTPPIAGKRNLLALKHGLAA